MSDTTAQLTALQTELAKSVYAADIATGNYNDILTQINAQTLTGSHWIARATLKNILDTNGIYSTLFVASLTPSSPYYATAALVVNKLNDQDYTGFRLENPEVQSMITAMTTAGIITSAQVTTLEAAFTAETTSIAEGILSRLATLDDIVQAIGMPLLTQLQNTLIPYAQTTAQGVLTPLQDAVNSKQAQIASYISTLQGMAVTLQAGNPVTLPTQAQITTALS